MLELKTGCCKAGFHSGGVKEKACIRRADIETTGTNRQDRKEERKCRK